MVPMDQLKPGNTGRITKMKGKRGFLSRISGIGFSVNEPVEMLQNNKKGPVIVSIRSSEIALGRKEASAVFIELP